MKDLKAGDRVKPSQYSLNRKEDEIRKWIRRSPQRARAVEAYEKEAARRGTVIRIVPRPKGFNKGSGGVDVQWDDGSTSSGMHGQVVHESDYDVRKWDA